MIPIDDFVQIGKALTKIEKNKFTFDKQEFIRNSNNRKESHVIGITGGPGVGKSSFINQFIKIALNFNLTVAVIAIDPTSANSGGTFLGDRIRLDPDYPSKGVFIRSLSSSNSLNGIPNCVEFMVSFLNSVGYELIIIETIGIGQIESDIKKYVQKVVVIPNNNEYDWIQVLKNESYLVADVFFFNSSEENDSKKISESVKLHIDINYSENSVKPECIVGNAKNGEGISEAFSKLTENKIK